MNNKIKILLKIIVSVGLIAFLINQVDFKEIINILKKVDMKMVFFAIVLLIMQIFIANFRWQLVLNCQKININFNKTLMFFWSGLFFNQVMPSSVGGDVIRGYYLKKWGMSIEFAALGVLMDRLFGILGLTLLVLTQLSFLFEILNDTSAQSGAIIISISVTSGLAFLFFTDKLPGNFAHFRIIKGFYSLSKNARSCISDSYKGLSIIIISIIIHLLSVFAVMTISNGLGLNIDWRGLLLIIPIVTLIMVIPISIAGWGIREGVMVVGLSYLGVSSEAALVLSVLYGLSILFVSLPGGVIWIFNRTNS
jgi:glycosyltransferase 2 family protein